MYMILYDYDDLLKPKKMFDVCFIKTETQETREMQNPSRSSCWFWSSVTKGPWSDFLVKHLKAGFAVETRNAVRELVPQCPGVLLELDKLQKFVEN